MAVDDDGSADDEGTVTRPRAAEYVRMSTEHQQYSTENQADAIRSYAAARGIDIMRTYADEGRSGLRMDGREALQRLIADVQTGVADFSYILVYDVSRWGRFQDADESAYYEYVCRRAGIAVEYCAEPFENDGSPISTIVKGVKRAMAGEYSRELSAKVFAGQCRLIERGYRQGGPAGFGLRRRLIDQSGAAKGELATGEQKSIQTDRVVLVPGPAAEVEIVRGIFRAFVERRASEREIADQLNAEGVLTDHDRPWSRGVVHQILVNPKYVGDNVWNRISFKLKKARIRNDPAMWIRAEGAFPMIVDRALFEAAQQIIRERSHRLTDAELLGALRDLLAAKGRLSGLIIDEAEHVPSSSAYQSRFGSLLRAYRLVGYTPERDYAYVEINRMLRTIHSELVATTVAEIGRIGGTVDLDPETDLLTVNDEFTVSLAIARCSPTPAGSLRWTLRFDESLKPDVTVAVRMDRSNRNPFDYYILPRTELAEARLRLCERNGVLLDAFRFDRLDALGAMSARRRIREVA